MKTEANNDKTSRGVSEAQSSSVKIVLYRFLTYTLFHKWQQIIESRVYVHVCICVYLSVLLCTLMPIKRDKQRVLQQFPIRCYEAFTKI